MRVMMSEATHAKMRVADSLPDVETDTETDVTIVEQYRPLLSLERPYRVIIHNDDVTTFDFVISLMVALFGHSHAKANDIAWETHTKGFAFVCSLPREEARRKVEVAHQAARAANFPLRFTIEPGWLGN